MSEQKNLVPSSDDIRDALAETLYDGVVNGVEEVIKDAEGNQTVVRVKPPASFLAVVVQYLKNNPPATVPSAGSTTGLLKEHAKVLNLPFGAKKAVAS